MMWRRIAGVMLALPVAMATCQLLAQNQNAQNQNAQNQNAQNQGQVTRHDRLQMLVTSLNLNEQQKEQARKICSEFDDKVSKLDHQFWSLVDQEQDQIFKVLNDQQRAKAPTVLREQREKELQKIAGMLGLNDAQVQKLREACEKFEPKFHEVAQQKGQEAFKKMHELRHEAFASIGQELTPEQRAKLPGVIREEIMAWHDPSMRSEHLRTIGDKLGLNDDQRNQIKQILGTFSSTLEQTRTELRQVLQQEHAALDQVLNEQQRTKLREMTKINGNGK